MQLRKAALSIAMGGVLCLPVTQAQADSLLAPWVVSDPAQGIETILSLKFEGEGFIDSDFGSTSAVHYYWFRAPVGGTCSETNTRGTVSSWDMVWQTVGGLAPLALPFGDQSGPQFIPAPISSGFMILDDEGSGNEGNFSGFAYVVDLTRGDVLDFKLLNNPRSTLSGDFAALGKRYVDFSWQHTFAAPNTSWLVLAVGPAMTNQGGWNGSVLITQDGFAQQPFGGFGVYDNDERVWSGAAARDVGCQAIITRSDIMTDDQEIATADGGWTRKAIQPTNPNTTGALVYKIETLFVGPNDMVVNHETSGYTEAVVNDLP